MASPNPSPSGADPAETVYAPSALPSTGARVLAFAAILVAGLCGGLIGYAVVDLQCSGNCTAASGFAGLVGAILFAVGVGVVATLALRAMGEWRVVQHRSSSGQGDGDPRRGTGR